MRLVALLFLASCFPACAKFVSGSSQTVTVATTPPATACTLDRVEVRLGGIVQMPGSVRLDRSRNDLTMACSKPGYQMTTVVYSPSFGGATFGTIIPGDGIGVAMDAASGANYE